MSQYNPLAANPDSPSNRLMARLRRWGLALFIAAIILLAAAYGDLIDDAYRQIAIRTGMVMTMLGALLAAFGTLWMRANRVGPRGSAPRWVPAAVAASIALVAVLLWGVLRDELAANHLTQARQRLESVSNSISLTLKNRTQALNRFGRRVARISDPQLQSLQFEEQAAALMHDFPSILSLVWADPQAQVVAVEPANAKGLYAPGMAWDTPWLPLLKASRADASKAQYSPIRVGLTGDAEFLLVQPAGTKAGVRGYLLTAFNATKLVERALRPLERNLPLRITNLEGLVLFQRGNSDTPPVVSQIMPGSPHGLRIEVRQSLSTVQEILPDALLASGLALAALLGITLHFAIVLKQRVYQSEALREDILLQMIERERAQELLRETADELRSVFDSISDAVYLLDGHWCFAYLNPRAQSLLRRSPEALLGKNIWAEYPELVGTPFEENFRTAMAQQQTRDFTVHFDQLHSWFNLRVYPNADGLAVYFQDVTARQVAEDALRLSESRFRKIALATADAAWDWDLTNNALWWSDGPHKRFGHRLEAVQPDVETWTDYIHPDDRDAVMNSLQAAIDSQNDNWEDEYRYRRGDGSYAYVIDRGVVIRDEHGKALRMVGGMNDVTERRLNEERLRDNEEYLRAILDTALEGMISVDAVGHIVQVNRAAEQIFGYSRNELLDQSIGLLMPAPDRRRHDDHIERFGTTSLARLQGNRREFAGLRRDGTSFPMELSVIEVNRAGRPLFTGFIRDITKRRKMEMALQKTLSDLDQRNHELQDFAFVASHDLQEPLRKIRMFSDRLLQHYSSKLDNRAREYLQRNAQAGMRMQTLIDDLLAYSRVTTRGENFVPVDLNLLMTTIVDDLAARLESSGGHVHWEGMPTIKGDATQLRQLFQNLVANALKFRRPDLAPIVQISAEPIQLSAGNDGWQISVADNGIGFAPEHAERIFAPFQRLHGRSEYEGSGIGLAIVRRIVERHGGHISAISALSKGANFVLQLPTTPPASESDGAAVQQ